MEMNLYNTSEDARTVPTDAGSNPSERNTEVESTLIN